MPLFSILIPTRNRADLLRYAIQSVLQQDCDDYELIVSDNDSSDDTHKTTLEFNSQKIRYVNTGKYLPGDVSWNFAYTQAASDYILALGDDDYLVPGILKQVKKVIQEKSALMVSWGLITYYDATYNEVIMRNTITARKFTNKIFKVDTKDVLKAYFDLDPRPTIYPPHPSSVFISRYLTEKIRHKYGVFFAPPFTDITAISRSLAYTDSLFVIDKPLVIIGRTSRSFVTKFAWAINDARKEHPDSELAAAMFSGEYTYNLHVESLRQVKHGDPERFKDCEINMARYCILYYQDMLNASRRGYDTSSDLKEFYWKLSSLPPNIQRSVRKYIRKTRIKELLLRSPLWNIAAIRILAIKLYTLFQRDRGIKSIRGNSIGVYDIAGCAEHLIEIAQALKQPIEAWDSQRTPTSCDHGVRFVEE